jgi:hypothetical protein
MRNSVDESLSIPQPGDRIVWLHGFGKPGYGKLYDEVVFISDGIVFCRCHWDGDISTDPRILKAGDILPLTMCVKENEITPVLLKKFKDRNDAFMKSIASMIGNNEWPYNGDTHEKTL